MVDEIINILKFFSDKNRLFIVLLLSEYSLCVCELAELLGVTAASVSRNLSSLSKLGILDGKKESFWTVYSLKLTNKNAIALCDLISSWLDESSEIEKIKKRIPSLDRNNVCKCRENKNEK